MRKVTLQLSDGTEFHGKSFGYEQPVAGEVVFNTAMMGYPESLTDPSYAGQLLTMTFPLVGNYGVPPFTFDKQTGLPDFMESDRIYASALIVSDYSEQYSHWNAVESLGEWLQREKVPGITGIDTRELTKVLREHGVMMGKILFDDEPNNVPEADYEGVNFVDLRDAGDPIELAQRYDEQRADEVIFLDITATHEGRATTVDMASRASEELHLPYCVGGGFRSVEDIRTMIAAGADKVSVNSAAIADPTLITKAAAAFGTQAILCAIDAKQVPGNPNKWEVYVHGGRKNTGLDAVEWAAEAARRGAGEILLTSMDRDGSKDGFDLALTRAVSRAVNIPVIASGGVGKLEHFAEGIIEGEADAVLAASVFHFGELTIREVKEYMRSQGIPVRL